MIYAGQINKNIVAQLQAHNTNAMGFSEWWEFNPVRKETIPPSLRICGRCKISECSAITNFANGITPVFCAITHDKNGQLLNTNADTIASELAIALSALLM
jgi:acetylglutamate kinase